MAERGSLDITSPIEYSPASGTAKYPGSGSEDRYCSEVSTPIQQLVLEEPPVTAAFAFSQQDFPEGGFEAYFNCICCCSTIWFFFLGNLYAWGAVQDALTEEKVASTATLAFLGALVPTLETALAVPVAWLVGRIGLRSTALLGSLCSGFGPFLASFTIHNIAGLFITQGCLAGIGAAMCFNTTAALPSQYFKVRRGLATGIVYALGGLGAACLSLLLGELIPRVGIPWAMRTVGLLTLAFCVP